MSLDINRADPGQLKIRFILDAWHPPGEVSVVGSFNDWSRGTLHLRDDDHDGIWNAAAVLPAGQHEYMFVVDGGNDLDFPASGCPGIHADPQLGPLADNGGPTLTHALGAGSAARDTEAFRGSCGSCRKFASTPYTRSNSQPISAFGDRAKSSYAHRLTSSPQAVLRLRTIGSQDMPSRSSPAT